MEIHSTIVLNEIGNFEYEDALPFQHSSNIGIQFDRNGQYQECALTISYLFSRRKDFISQCGAIPLEVQSDDTFILDANSFVNDGYVAIGFNMTKDNETENIGYVVYEVKKSVGGVVLAKTDDETIEVIVNSIINQKDLVTHSELGNYENIIEEIRLNGVPQDVVDKVVDLLIDLTNYVEKNGDNMTGDLSFDKLNGIVLYDDNSTDTYWKIYSGDNNDLVFKKFVSNVDYGVLFKLTHNGTGQFNVDLQSTQFVQTSQPNETITPKNIFVESVNQDGVLVKYPKDNLFGKGQYGFKLTKTGLIININDDEEINLLDSINLNDAVMTYNTVLGTDFTQANGLLKFPGLLVNNKPYTKYDITVRLSGMLGVLATTREFEIRIDRSDNTTVETKSMIKTVGSNLDSKSVQFLTYTKDNTDPFITSGIKLVLRNNTGANMNINGISIFVNGVNE